MKRPSPLRLNLLAGPLLLTGLLLCDSAVRPQAGAKPAVPTHSAASRTSDKRPPTPDSSKRDLTMAVDIRRASDALTQVLTSPPRVDDGGAFVASLQKAEAALQIAGSKLPPVPAGTVAAQESGDPGDMLDAAHNDIEDALTLADKEASAPSLRQALGYIVEAREELAKTKPDQPVGPATATPRPSSKGEGSGVSAATLPGLLPALLNGLAVALLLFLLSRLRRLQPASPSDDGSLDVTLGNLETRATEAADRYKNLSANYDQLEEQYNDLAAQHEQISAQLSDLQRESGRPRRAYEEPLDRVPELPNLAAPVIQTSQPEGSSPNPEPITIPVPQPAPAASFGSDPERDYIEARRNPGLQAEFKRIYSPVVVTCTNLSQRGVTGVQLTFVQDSRSSLFAVANPTRALIFPSFASDPAYARDLLEGIYAYPAEFTHLTVVAAAQAERKGDTFYLTLPGQLRNA